MVQLHPTCQNYLLDQQYCPGRTLREGKIKYLMSIESEEPTVIQSKPMKTAHLKGFRTEKIGLSGMATWMI